MVSGKTNKAVRLAYGIFFSLFTVVVGALFIWQILSVFSSSADPVMERHPFTREIALAALGKIDLFFWLWVGAAIAGFVLCEIFPAGKKPRKISPDLQYGRLIKRLPSVAPENLSAEFNYVRTERKIIFAVKCAGWALFAVACIVGIVYLAIPSNFNNRAVTLEILDMVKVVFPCVFAALIVLCAIAAYEKFMIKSMLPSLKALAAGNKPKEDKTLWEKIEGVFDNKYVLLGVRIALGVIAAAFILWGILNGNMRSILIKAINICTECIGLG